MSAFRALVIFRPPVRPRAATSCSCRVLGIGLLSAFIKPVIYGATVAEARWTTPLRALAWQPVESFPWDKLQTVPLSFTSRESAFGHLKELLIAQTARLNNHGNLREYRGMTEGDGEEDEEASFPKFLKPFRIRELASMRQNSTCLISLYYLRYTTLYKQFRTMLKQL